MSRKNRDSILEVARSEFMLLRMITPHKRVYLRLAAVLAGLVVSLVSSISDRQKELPENSDYKEQLEQLNQVESNINELLAFVENQKVELKDAEDTIAALESEQQALEPIIKTNREVVDAIFQVQEERTRANVWQERGIGFGLGIVASVVASLLLSVGQTVLKRRSSDENESPPEQ